MNKMDYLFHACCSMRPTQGAGDRGEGRGKYPSVPTVHRERQVPESPSESSRLFFFFKDFLKFLFTFRKRGREGEREGKKHQCVVASHTPPTGDLACNPGLCPDWESNQWPFGSQPTLNPLSCTSQDNFILESEFFISRLFILYGFCFFVEIFFIHYKQIFHYLLECNFLQLL